MPNIISPAKTPEYKDFLGEHKGAQRGQQQIVFVDGLKGLRMGVKDADKDFMIFDTLNDPQESKDLASSKPELQARMKAAALSNRRLPFLPKQCLILRWCLPWM